MAVYIHQLPHWPAFRWNHEKISPLLARIRNRQGRLLGRMEALGFNLRAEANLETLILDVQKSSEIEGELLDAEQIRSSLAKRLGMDIAGLPPAERNVEGVVEMLLDATQQYQQPLSAERLFGWHAALFPNGRSGMHTITVAAWRNHKKEDPIQVISGAMGKEKVHFEAPDSDRLEAEMQQFINWFNEDLQMDPVLKAAVAHLWFITLHPFDDGNGRMARAITDLQLARTDESKQRFYSMSAQIRKERKTYYHILEKTQQSSMDITGWVTWFLECLERAVDANSDTLSHVLLKANFWEKHLATAFNPRQHLMLNKLLDRFEGKLTTSKWAKITKTSSDTALRDIQDLIEKQVLMKETSGGRSTSYVIVH